LFVNLICAGAPLAVAEWKIISATNVPPPLRADLSGAPPPNQK
jgi:hypothetical protein